VGKEHDGKTGQRGDGKMLLQRGCQPFGKVRCFKRYAGIIFFLLVLVVLMENYRWDWHKLEAERLTFFRAVL